PAHEGGAGPHRPDVVGRRLVPPHRRPRLRRRPAGRPAVLSALSPARTVAVVPAGRPYRLGPPSLGEHPRPGAGRPRPPPGDRREGRSRHGPPGGLADGPGPARLRAGDGLRRTPVP